MHACGAAVMGQRLLSQGLGSEKGFARHERPVTLLTRSRL